MQRSLEPFKFEHIVEKAKLSSKTASKQVTYLSHLTEVGDVREACDLNRNQDKKEELKKLTLKQRIKKEKQEAASLDNIDDNRTLQRDFQRSEIATKDLTERACEFLRLVRSMRECSHITVNRRFNRFKNEVTTLFFSDGKLDYVCPKHRKKKHFSRSKRKHSEDETPKKVPVNEDRPCCGIKNFHQLYY